MTNVGQNLETAHGSFVNDDDVQPRSPVLRMRSRWCGCRLSFQTNRRRTRELSGAQDEQIKKWNEGWTLLGSNESSRLRRPVMDKTDDP